MRALLALALAATLPQIAVAADWRYCLAPSPAEHKIYLSLPFAATLSMDHAESQFARRLKMSGVRFEDVQCPRGDSEAEAISMQRHAISLNRQLGNQVIDLHWQPELP